MAKNTKSSLNGRPTTQVLKDSLSTSIFGTQWSKWYAVVMHRFELNYNEAIQKFSLLYFLRNKSLLLEYQN